MDKLPAVELTWQGQETVDRITGLIGEAFRIRVTLPEDVNHALFRSLNPDAPTNTTERFDVASGPEVLGRIARVRGLEPLAELQETLDAVRARVRVVSPPTLVIHPFGLPAGENGH